MEELKGKTACTSLVLSIVLFLVLAHPCGLRGADIPSFEDVIRGKADLPTIEDLTNGKVKVGDLINKDNVDTVKEYLSPAIYSGVKQGMVLTMSSSPSYEQMVPKYFIDITERNKGKAVMDENGTVYYEKQGVLWPGGIPYPEPKTGLEVMANTKFGLIWDEFRNYPIKMILVDSTGKSYKSVGQEHRYIKFTGRTKVPPIGAVPGYEDLHFKRLVVMHSPLEIKGLGQYSVRYYDDTKYYDTGFAYLPAFKRTIRVSATTWQDNVAGSDLTHQDGMGMQDPYSGWTFKLLESKYILLIETKSPFEIVNEKGKINEKLQFDVGRKFPRFGWSIWPVYVVEALPKHKNIYAKKTLYVNAWPYFSAVGPCGLADMYDQQMKLWKFYKHINGRIHHVDGDPFTLIYGFLCYDLQVGHMTQYWFHERVNDFNYKPDDVSLKTLLEAGR
ncbi:MAG: DUF1329 domain-containing protein [Thermodesulfobacteriota bacterium]|nr:DUF1329 domain-containing protein [Thermodesulfobacteriota bacterium]